MSKSTCAYCKAKKSRINRMHNNGYGCDNCYQYAIKLKEKNQLKIKVIK